MSNFARGKYAQFISDRSGQAFPYTEMVIEWNGARVHTSEFEAKHPQLDPKPTTADGQGLRNARPQTFTLASGGGGGMHETTYTGGDSRKINSGGVTFLDSPATTSSTNYKVEIASSNNGSTVYLNRWALNTDVGAVSSITLMEIAQ